MRIYLKIFKDKNFGNYKIDYILISTDKITVNDLKQIIFQKYGIEKSSQRLLIKLNNYQFIIMNEEFPLYMDMSIVWPTNEEFPLFFFKIEEKSIIYVDIFQKPNKDDDILKKIKIRELKSRYLRRLNIFQKRPNMDIIKESSIEDVDDTEIKSFSLKDTNHININNIENNSPINSNFIISKNNFSDNIKERFFRAIINNNINEFKEIMSHYSEFININKPIGNKKIYSAIHYASIYEYCEIMEELVNKYNANMNLISVNGWSPLHLSAYIGNINIIYSLFKFKNTNYDLVLPKIGTPLHCACKRNNFKVVALLLHKCNPNIRNDKELFPIDVTTDINVKKLINKTLNIYYDFEDNINDLSISRKIKSDEGEGEHITKAQLAKFKFLKSLSFIPPHPDRFSGYVYKKGKIFSHYNLRYIEINAIKNFLMRFLSKDDYPAKPKEVISLRDIVKCRKKKKSDEGKYYIEIQFEKFTHLYRFDSLKTCNIWLDEINKSIKYTKFWINLEKNNVDVIAYLSSLKQDLYEIDYLTGEVKKLESNQNKKNNTESKNISILNNINNNSRRNTVIGREEDLKIIENNLLNNSSVNINSFEILDLLCVGNFGKVYKVKFKLNGEIFSMKVLNKKYLTKNNQLKYTINECNIIKHLVSPFIITLHYSFQTSENLYFIFDFCSGGDLNFHVLHTLFEEDEVKFYIAEIILAIEYLHKMDMVYNNLNCENILISNDNHIKLADFGIIKQGSNEIQTSNTIFDGINIDKNIIRGIGRSSDIYGIGAILYEMICGTPPYYSSNFKSNIKNKGNELVFHDYFSDELKDLLKKLLNREPNKRIGLSNKIELKNHPWFKDIDWDMISRKGIKPPINFVLMKKEFDNDDINNINNEKNIK